MLPTNVMTFMKKMVSNEPGTPEPEQGAGDTPLSKLKQTLSSSLLTAQDKVTKLNTPKSCDTPSSPPDEKKLTNAQNKDDGSSSPSSANAPNLNKTQSKSEPGKQTNRIGNCRVCLKSFKPGDYSRICFECHQKVCEDCASYSKLDDNQEENSWRCSVCRWKLPSRVQPILAQSSTDSFLDVPAFEALKRRQSDGKIGSSSSSTVTGVGALGTGLTPPRTEIRRHSDVSPASLKELEKAVLKVTRDREEWAQKKDINGSVSPGKERRGTIVPDNDNANLQLQSSKELHLDASPPSDIYDNGLDFDDMDDPDNRRGRGAQRSFPKSRRKSKVQKQHSCDDEVKNNSGGLSSSIDDMDSGLPPQLSRRKSAYDVYLSNSTGLSTVGGRDPASRRSSFRGPTSVVAEDHSGLGQMQLSDSLGVDEERRARRRGSLLPDINAIKAGLPQIPIRSSVSARLNQNDEDSIRRQASAAAEDIRIVINDVDSDERVINTKRKLTLMHEARKLRGFGMRVVGGKIGSDGRLFAYIVWIVPRGPAEKAGLQQGDKVLEWNGSQLTDRSFAEVCEVLDGTGDKAEIIVEHAADVKVSDFMYEPLPPGSRKNSDCSPMGIQLGPEVFFS